MTARAVRATQTLFLSAALIALAACGGGSGNNTPSAPSSTYSVGGTVSGLNGTLVLQNNGTNNLTIGADGSFTFSTALLGGGSYAVTVLTQPSNPAQQCAVSNGSGVIASANITSVVVTCVPPTLVSMAVAPASMRLNLEKTGQLVATGTYSDGSQSPISGSVTWQSSDNTIATVDAAGIVTGVALGATPVTATVGPISANASITVLGKVSLTKTGQTVSYAAGDDGDIRAGIAAPQPRFVVNDCGTPADTSDDFVTDQLTGLTWIRNHGGTTTRTWQASLDYANGLSLCGFSDWRLANVTELTSLVSAGENSFASLATQGFIMSQVAFWSSTSQALHSSRAWSVDLYGGVGEYPKTTTGAAWAVRGLTSGSVVELARTGQTSCYDTSGAPLPCTGSGQDGELQAGVAAPSARFVLDECSTATNPLDDVITDTLTGLMWPRAANLFGVRVWTQALQDANDLTVCGYNDWRLPNQLELRSLVNYEQSNLGAWLVSQNFQDVQSQNTLMWYWSSTSYLNDPATYALRGNLFDGTIDTFGAKLTAHYVWPVRGGL